MQVHFINLLFKRRYSKPLINNHSIRVILDKEALNLSHLIPTNAAYSKRHLDTSVDTPVTFGFRDETAERPWMAHSVSQVYLHIPPPGRQ